MFLGNYNIIPLGPYDHYPRTLNKKACRKILNIDEDCFVFSSFGRIEPYKGVLNLIDAFSATCKTNPSKKICLIIAGKCTDTLYKAEIQYKINAFRGLKLKNARIVQSLNYVEESNVQLFHTSADFEVYPFTEITNSSSVLLSFAFDKPVIAPSIGAIKDIPINCGIFYEALTASDNLTESMLEAIKLKNTDIKKYAANSRAFSNSLSWDKISRATYNVYKNLTS